MRARSGLTLIEVLIAIVIFVVMLTAVSQSLLPLFGLTRDTRAQLDANQRAQQVVEALRTAWLDASLYKKTCAPISLPPGVTVQVQALDNQARPVGTRSFSTDCGTAIPDTTPVPAKRVTVTAYDTRGKVRARLTLDIRGP